MELAQCYVSENQSLGGCTDGQAAAGGETGKKCGSNKAETASG